MDLASENTSSGQQWLDIQNQTFLSWCNHHLEKRNIQVSDVSKDFSDGVNLINLVEIVTGKSIGRYVRVPKFPAHRMANITEALNFMERVLSIKVVGCNARDIMDGNQKQCMGVIFLLMNKIKAIDAIRAAGGTVTLGEPLAPLDFSAAIASNRGIVSPRANVTSPRETGPSPRKEAPKAEEPAQPAEIPGTPAPSEPNVEYEVKPKIEEPQQPKEEPKVVEIPAVVEPAEPKADGTPASQKKKKRDRGSKIIVTDESSSPSKAEAAPATPEEKPKKDKAKRLTKELGLAPKDEKSKRNSGKRKSVKSTELDDALAEGKRSSATIRKEELVAKMKPFENKIVLIQSLFRAVLARQRWAGLRQSRLELVDTITKSPKILKGICRVQAVVRGREVREANRKRRRRNEIAKEIASTEEKYVASLSIAVEIYLKRLKALGEDVINASALRTIFSEIEVIRSYNTVINAKIKARMANWFKEGQKLGDIFLLMTDFLKVYTAYVNNYNLALKTLTDAQQHSKVAKVLLEARTSQETGNLELSSFLIMPIQRIPRYVMLLTDLFKHTPANHVDYENLKKALQKMEHVADYVNQKKREAENLMGVLSIARKITHLDNSNELAQPHRRFVRQGPLSEFDGKAYKPRYTFLFTDSIMITKAENSFLQKVIGKDKSVTSTADVEALKNFEDKFKFGSIAYLAGARLIDVPEDKTKASNVFEIEIPPSKDAGVRTPASTIPDAGGKISVSAPTAADKEAWMSDVDEIVMSLLEKKRSRLEIPVEEERAQQNMYLAAALAMSSGPSIGEGKLMKRGQTGDWKERFFYLEGSVLKYYKTKAAFDAYEAPTNTIYLLFSSVQLVGVMDRPFCFQILTKERIYYLSIPSSTPSPSVERINWVSSLRDGISKHLLGIEKKFKPKLILASGLPATTPTVTVSSSSDSLNFTTTASATLNTESKSKKRASGTITSSAEASLSVELAKEKERKKTVGTLKKKTGSVSANSTPEKETAQKPSLAEKSGELVRVPEITRKFKVVLQGQTLSLFKKKKVASDTIDLAICEKVKGPSTKKVGEETYYCFKIQTPQLVYTLGSTSESEVADWVDKLNSNLERLHS